MGWTDKTTTLEDIALIASEIGEAANECRGEKIGDGLKDELADIILRTLGTARKAGINIESAIVEKMRKNRERGNSGRLK
jgi:NTP pyrophosphatase (non-canonical NTP hydrolase)